MTYTKQLCLAYYSQLISGSHFCKLFYFHIFLKSRMSQGWKRHVCKRRVTELESE